MCGVPVRSKSEMYNTVSTTLGVISGVAVLLRLYSKFALNSPWGLDDTFVMLTLAAGIPTSVLVPHGLTSNGLGRDIWTVTPEQITQFIHIFYASEALYFAQVALLKLSLLFFYLRIFPAPSIKRFILGTVAFDICYGITFVFLSLFQCKPIDYYWTKWDGEHTGTCLNVNVLGWTNAAISIVLDAWMLSLPMHQLMGLQLHWKKKIGVAMMFVVGTFVTVISIVRLQSLVHFANSTNPTWDDLPVGVWSTVEINVGIICVCMPNLRVLLVRAFPKFLGSSNNSKHYLKNSHSQMGGNISVNKPGKSLQGSVSGITYSQTYSVKYANQRDQDEAELIEMNNFSKGMESKPSSHVSEVSL
ncbi:hypothetical protein G7Y89_g2516 [Cudoniella acicularis]|uniref:Rhodopsin domain-containing protein n=1 Tax=Cudoniella acicularis TaxID=354080 RepID=A0A8H4W6F4_9HELO|nr:hypothetical protein G7Y89_g2516 [Cudoniella acicularis]